MWCVLSSTKKNHTHFWTFAFKFPALLKLQRCVPLLAFIHRQLTSPHPPPLTWHRSSPAASWCHVLLSLSNLHLNDGMSGRLLDASPAGVVLLEKKESVCVCHWWAHFLLVFVTKDSAAVTDWMLLAELVSGNKCVYVCKCEWQGLSFVGACTISCEVFFQTAHKERKTDRERKKERQASSLWSSKNRRVLIFLPLRSLLLKDNTSFIYFILQWLTPCCLNTRWRASTVKTLHTLGIFFVF